MISAYHKTTIGKGAVLAAGLAIAAVVGSASSTCAQEAKAGSAIQNIAEVSFVQFGDAGRGRSNLVETLVAERLDVAVDAVNSVPTPVRGGERAEPLPFRVVNGGNGSEAFSLEAVTAGGAVVATVVGIAIDRDGDGRYDATVDTAYRPGADELVLAPGEGITVFVLCDLPSGLADGAEGSVSLTARATTGTGAEGLTFASMGDGGGDAVVGATGADATATSSFVVSTGAARLTKRQSVMDRLGGGASIPGSTITYELLVEISGTRALDEVTITDAIPAGTTYVTDSLRLQGRVLSDSADTDMGRGDQTGIQVALGTLAPSTALTVSFQVRIN